ncbi:cyclin-F-like [Acanthaster planci]|uniref:Cyclin-F n=1 Tax=Acanthaster planci TaxID=133434 RepID=A0A8B7Y883_ACAPL|nr:cyclin-F-like [Acanthaster planci]
MKEFHAAKTKMYSLRSYTLSSLPHEVLVQLFKFLPLRDLINTRQVCSKFKWLIDSTPHLWTTATLVDEWPNNVNFNHFERAANMDNVEALIKMGIACLYNEGYPGSFDNDTSTKGHHAADFLCRAERLLKGRDLFLWALIRPPWSKNSACCKATVFKLLKEMAVNSQECDETILYCIARITIILQDEDPDDDGEGCMAEDTHTWLARAAAAGSHKAMLQLWQYNEKECLDAASKLDRIRQLREIVASHPSKVAKMELFNAYAKGHFGGLLESQAAEATRAYVQESGLGNSHNIFNVQSSLNNAMRYILVDWLVEVASMKGYSSHTLHMVVGCIDRYLMHQPVSRGNLQLVGITAMVICSRLLEPDIITIREAAWLTDRTYRYEKVVRMMGDILATLHGKIDVPSMWEYLILYCQLVGADRRLKYLALYISELTLLHIEFGRYSFGHLAACVFYLARIIYACDCPWPSKLIDYTSFQPGDLVSCTLHVHKKCFAEEPLLDHRNIKLSAVKQRYAEDEFHTVSTIAVLDHAALCTQLYVKENDLIVEDKILPLPGTPTPCGRIEPFLLSPSRTSRSNRHQEEPKQDREDLVTTPTGELSTSALERSFQEAKNESMMSLESGYDADMESDAEGESLTDAANNNGCIRPTPIFDTHLSDATSSVDSQASTSTAAGSSHKSFHSSQAQPTVFTSAASSIPIAQSQVVPSVLCSTSNPKFAAGDQQSPNNSIIRNNRNASMEKLAQYQRPYSGQAFKFDSNGKLRLGSPRRPLKRLENSHCRRKSRRQFANRRNTSQQHEGENVQLQT